MPLLPRLARLRLGLLTLALVLTGGACAKSDYAHIYQTAPFAPSYARESIANLEHMGATLVDKGVNFAVYSEHATKLQLALFDDPESNRPTRQLDMVRQGDVWNLYVEGVGIGQAYGFIAWGPNWDFDPRWYCGSIHGFKSDVDGDGNRFDPNKLLLDPYAKEIHRDHDWSRGSTATGPKRAECDYGAAAKSLVIQSTYAWSDGEGAYRTMRQGNETVGHRWQDLVVYEAHPKGLTADSGSGVLHPGTYRGIGEKAAYFKKMGINAVELMPVFEKPLDGGYWGYQTIGFFMPSRAYANEKLRWGPVEEFKWMVDQLHQQGIEVLLDVVYNHTGEGGLWRQYIQDSFSPDPTLDPSKYSALDPKEVAGLYSFRGLDNQAYYALAPDHQTYWNNTGVGQETRPNHAPMRRLVLDSLRYWVEEFHVDGFRFDLAPQLNESDQDYNTQSVDSAGNMTGVPQEIVDDPTLQKYNTRLVAEPWSLAAFMVSRFPSASSKDGTAWGEWNGPFRDWWRQLVNQGNTDSTNEGDAFHYATSMNTDEGFRASGQTQLSNAGFFLFGSPDYYIHNSRRPYHSFNFVTIHDGFTMYDLLSYGQKINGCGPLDPACCPQSPGICDEHSGEDNNRSQNWGGLSWGGKGSPNQHHVIYADGQKACETTADGQGNWGCTITHDAGEAIKRRKMRDLFMAMLLAHGTPTLLGGDEWMRTQLGNNNAYSSGADNPYNWFAWGEWQADPFRVRMADFVRQAIAVRSHHRYAFAPDQYGSGAPFKWMNEAAVEGPDWNSRHLAQYWFDPAQGKPLYVIWNMESHGVDFTLPSGHHWNRLVDTQSYFDDPAYFTANALDPSISANGSVDSPMPVGTPSYNTPAGTVVVLEAAD
jgi:isoamylase